MSEDAKIGSADDEPDQEPSSARPGPEARSLASRLSEVAEDIAGEVADRLRQLAIDAGSVSLSMGRAFFVPPDNQRLAEEAGHYLRELRELAGLTVDELAAAIKLEDRTVIEAVEEGTATLSFELALRLAAILARHDPIPFMIQFTRTYNPELWGLLEGVGAGRLPLQFERERKFVNIFRGEDDARGLSDEGFERVLELTRAAFQLGLQYAVAHDRLDLDEREPEDGELDEEEDEDGGA